MPAPCSRPLAERIALRRVALDALTVYLGATRGAGAPFNGQIERGDVSTIRAAILIADLRGFTPDVRPPGAARDGGAARPLVRRHGCGDRGPRAATILKFMGDGLLAVFPLDDDPKGSCARGAGGGEEHHRRHGEAERGARERRQGGVCVFGLAPARGAMWSSAISARHGASTSR